MESETPMTVLKSKHTQNKFSVEREIARKYLQVVRNFEGEEEDFELDLNDENIQLVIQYINHHGVENPPAVIPKPLPSKDLSLYVSEWDHKFITSLNEVQQANLMDAANYLSCQELLELIAAHTVSILIGSTLEELREEYGITEQLTPQLEEQIKKDHEKNIFQHTKFEQFQARDGNMAMQNRQQQQMQQQQSKPQ